MSARLNLKGKRYGRLVVLETAGTNAKNETLWRCLCDCGNEKTIRTKALEHGCLHSCGCYNKEITGGRFSGKRSPKWAGLGDMSLGRWSRILTSAKKRNLPVTISHQDCWDLFQAQNGRCALTGALISFQGIGCRQNTSTASLDRIDSSKGYIKGNVQWVHKTVQTMKNVFSQVEFIDLCGQVTAYQTGAHA